MMLNGNKINNEDLLKLDKNEVMRKYEKKKKKLANLNREVRELGHLLACLNDVSEVFEGQPLLIAEYNGVISVEKIISEDNRTAFIFKNGSINLSPGEKLFKKYSRSKRKCLEVAKRWVVHGIIPEHLEVTSE